MEIPFRPTFRYFEEVLSFHVQHPAPPGSPTFELDANVMERLTGLAEQYSCPVDAVAGALVDCLYARHRATEEVFMAEEEFRAQSEKLINDPHPRRIIITREGFPHLVLLPAETYDQLRYSAPAVEKHS